MEEENAKKKKTILFILAIATIIIYVIIFIMLENSEEELSRRSARIVTNYSEFYTVSACANKYINYLASKDADSLLNVLSDSYKKKNTITSSNVLDALPIIASGNSFTANRMYYQEKKNGIYKYYISGFLDTGGLDMDERSRVKSYLIIYLDKKNTIFSVEPYEGQEYIDGVFE